MVYDLDWWPLWDPVSCCSLSVVTRVVTLFCGWSHSCFIQERVDPVLLLSHILGNVFHGLLVWWTREIFHWGRPWQIFSSHKLETKCHMSAEDQVKYLCLLFFGWITWPSFIQSFYQSSMGNLVNTGLECQTTTTSHMHNALSQHMFPWMYAG